MSTRYISQKIKNQKWLSFSLMLGIMLLVAIAACQPSFRNGCQNKLIRRLFDEYITAYNKYPVMIGEKGSVPDTFTENETEEEDEFHHSIRTSVEMDAYLDKKTAAWREALPGVLIKAERRVYDFSNVYGQNFYSEVMHSISIQYSEGLLEHITLTQGTDYNAGPVDGAYPCLVSEATLDHFGLAPGERITYLDYSPEEKELVFYIAGIFTETSEDDMYWYETEKQNPTGIYVSREVFDTIVTDYTFNGYKYYEYYMPDYTQVRNGSSSDLYKLVMSEKENNSRFVTSAYEMMADFKAKSTQINVMINVLELPIMGMMLAFLYMVSNQIVVTGQGQLATLKSRGFRKRKIMGMYLGEYAVLTAAAVVLGVPLGYGLCRIAAATSDFCVFTASDGARYPFRMLSLPYALAASVVALLFVMLPVVKHTNISIVEYKADNHVDKKMFWEKAWLDVVFLGLSLYFLYVFNQSVEQLRRKAISGNKMDPLMFLNVCLFIVAAGFFIFRLMHAFVRFVYFLRRKRWKPVAYAAFLQIIRSFRKQTFITVFMILTIAFGLFDANLDRTVNSNMEQRNQYQLGADVQLQEKWYIKNYMSGGRILYRYLEPDFVKYEELVQQGILERVTKVYKLENMATYEVSGIDMMGIETKAFGETTSLNERLYGDKHWYYSLNALSQEKNGAIISENMAEIMGLKVGDKFTIREPSAFNRMLGNEMNCVVADIVSAWPGYERYYYVNGEQMERALVVTNLSAMIQYFDVKPYEIWAKKAAGVTDTQVYEALTGAGNFEITSFTALDTVNAEQKAAPEIQILNGIFTLSFLITMLLCGVGFLIYWLISMKQRELLLGSYRAMGLSVASINGMLILEHIFSTLLAVIGGGIVGMAATYLFVPLFGVVFLPEKSVLEIVTCFEPKDITRLFVIVGTIIILCLLILRRQIKRMNITQALKLGED